MFLTYFFFFLKKYILRINEYEINLTHHIILVLHKVESAPLTHRVNQICKHINLF